MKETGVDVGEKILLGPFETEGVFGLGVGSVKSSSLDVGAPPGIIGWARWSSLYTATSVARAY